MLSDSVPSPSGMPADITLLVVTSPSPSNPSTELLTQSIESCNLIDGLQGCPVIIMLDGFKVGPVDRTKVGRITEESARRYEAYHSAILEQFAGPRYRVVRNASHQGFALTVKAGLELCTTTYCVIAQYDRMFCAPFARLRELISAMEEDEHIRYIGFPSSTNINHDKFISTNYNLYCLNKPGIKRDLGNHLYLQPLVFWFDSQHLAHVQRYLQIYRPYRNLPVHLREIIGIRSVKDMVLRPGDFIEDRFGQMQRRLLWALATKGRIEHTIKGTDNSNEAPSPASDNTEGAGAEGMEASEEQATEEGSLSEQESTVDQLQPKETPSPTGNDELVVELFRWYGSYLCWLNTSPTPYDVHLAHDHSDTLVMVRHLRGRQLNSDGVSWKLSTYSENGPATGGYWQNRCGRYAVPGAYAEGSDGASTEQDSKPEGGKASKVTVCTPAWEDKSDLPLNVFGDSM